MCNADSEANCVLSTFDQLTGQCHKKPFDPVMHARVVAAAADNAAAGVHVSYVSADSLYQGLLCEYIP